MRHHTHTFCIVVTVCVILTAACQWVDDGSGRKGVPKDIGRIVPASAPPPLHPPLVPMPQDDPLDADEEEAKAVAVRTLEKHLTTCGTSYVGRVMDAGPGTVPGFYEYRGLRVTVRKYPETRDDPWTGVTWRGAVEFAASSYRTWVDGATAWSEWHGPSPDAPIFIVGVEQVKGEWRTVFDAPDVRVDCADVPR
jgi:hypothetical protein